MTVAGGDLLSNTRGGAAAGDDATRCMPITVAGGDLLSVTR